MKHLLIVHHSKTGRTERLARAVLEGACHPEISGIEHRFLTAGLAGPADLLWADAVLLGTPENFGYMSGAMKDFFDRTFYEVEGQLRPLPCAIFICAGNDGSGALRAIRRIIGGYPMTEVQPAIIVKGEPAVADLVACRELGMAVAAGLDAGIY